MNLRELVKMAEKLDRKGDFDAADAIDNAIIRIASGDIDENDDLSLASMLDRYSTDEDSGDPAEWAISDAESLDGDELAEQFGQMDYNSPDDSDPDRDLKRALDEDKDKDLMSEDLSDMVHGFLAALVDGAFDSFSDAIDAAKDLMDEFEE